MSTKKTPEAPPRKGLATHPDGHPMLDGARWHAPKHGSPTECATPGCDRLMGQRPEPLLEADDLLTDDEHAAA